MKIRIGVSVDEDLLKQFRLICNNNNLKLSPVINELIRYFLSKQKEIESE